MGTTNGASTFLTALLAVIPVLALAIVQIITALKTGKQVAEVKAAVVADAKRTGAAADRVDEKLGEIHELTNSNLTKVRSDLQEANEKIAKLEALVTKLVEPIDDASPPAKQAAKLLGNPKEE